MSYFIDVLVLKTIPPSCAVSSSSVDFRVNCCVIRNDLKMNTIFGNFHYPAI